MKMMMTLAMASALMVPVVAHGADQAKQPKAEKKICRATGPAIGSILAAKRTCHTKSEWAEIEKANASNTDRFRDTRERNASMGRDPSS